MSSYNAYKEKKSKSSKAISNPPAQSPSFTNTTTTTSTVRRSSLSNEYSPAPDNGFGSGSPQPKFSAHSPTVASIPSEMAQPPSSPDDLSESESFDDEVIKFKVEKVPASASSAYPEHALYTHEIVMNDDLSEWEQCLQSTIVSLQTSIVDQRKSQVERRKQVLTITPPQPQSETTILNPAPAPTFVDDIEVEDPTVRKRDPVLLDSCSCYIYTRMANGKGRSWIKSQMQIQNHTLLITDNDLNAEGVSVPSAVSSSVATTRSSRLDSPSSLSSGSKRRNRVYEFGKGGNATEVLEYEGRSNVIFLTCVKENKSKHIAFNSAGSMHTWHQLFMKASSITGAEMATLQAHRLMNKPMAHLYELKQSIHPRDQPDEDFFKSAKTCAATGAKFAVFTKPSRCDNCGNGFASDQVKPRPLPHLPPRPEQSGRGHQCCFKCDRMLANRERLATTMETALESRDMEKILQIIQPAVTLPRTLPQSSPSTPTQGPAIPQSTQSPRSNVLRNSTTSFSAETAVSVDEAESSTTNSVSTDSDAPENESDEATTVVISPSATDKDKAPDKRATLSSPMRDSISSFATQVKRESILTRDSKARKFSLISDTNNAANATSPSDPVSLISPSFASASGLNALLVALTLPDNELDLASNALAIILSLSVDVNARAFHSVTGSVSFNPAFDQRKRALSTVLVNSHQVTGLTPLMAATMLNRIDFIEDLLIVGADPTLVGDANSQLTPLSYAASVNAVKSLSSLLKVFPNTLTNEDSIISVLPYTSISPIINFHANKTDKFSALHVAVVNNALDSAKLLMSYGATWGDSFDNFMKTPLHLAASLGFHKMIEVLYEFGKGSWNKAVIINSRDLRGNTAIQSTIAAYIANEVSEDEALQCFKSLINRGASVCTINSTDCNRQTCLSMINEYNRTNNILYIKSNFSIQVDVMGHAICSNRWDEVIRLIDNGNFLVDYMSAASEFLTPLAAASRYGNKAAHMMVKNLLAKGANPLAICGVKKDQHPVSIAAYYGQDEILATLVSSRGGGLETGEVIDESECVIDGSVTPLVRAVLGAAGVAMDFTHHFNNNSSSSSSNGSNANVVLKTKINNATEKVKALLCVKYLLDNNFNPLFFDGNNDTPLFLAVKTGDVEVVRCFVDFALSPGKNLNASLFSLDAPHSDGMTALMEAAKLGYTDLCTLLIDGGSCIDARDVGGKSCLMHAATSGQSSTLRQLLKLASHELIRSVDNLGFSLLHATAKFLHTGSGLTRSDDVSQMVSVLISAGVDVSLREYTKSYSAFNIVSRLPPDTEKPTRILTLLQGMDNAMQAMDYTEIETFVKRGNFPVDWVCVSEGPARGVTSLVHACSDCSGKGHDAVQMLINNGANVNYTSYVKVAPFPGAAEASVTPLLKAVMCGNVGATEILLERGSNLGAVPVSGEGGSFILLAAAQARRMKLIEILLSAGVDANSKINGVTPLFIASGCGDVDVCDQLILVGGAKLDTVHSAVAFERAVEMVKIPFLEGQLCGDATALMMAAFSAKPETLSYLLSRGADDAVVDEKGRVALHYAARSGDLGTVKALLSHSSSRISERSPTANAIDKSKRSPLMDACVSGSVAVVSALLDAGADPSAVAIDGVTSPLTEAVKTGIIEIVEAIDVALSKDDKSIVTGNLTAFIERVKRKASPVDYEARADVNKYMKDVRKRASSLLKETQEEPKIITALMKACELKNAKWIEELIKLGADVNLVCSGGEIPYDCPVMACARTGDLPSMLALLKTVSKGKLVDTNALNNNVTPLCLAVVHDIGPLVRILLKNGSNPLLPCSDMGLINFAVSIDGSDTTCPLMLASSTGRVNSVKEIVTSMLASTITEAGQVRVRYNINAMQGTNRVNALMCASYAGHLACARCLCEGKANVTAQDRLGRSPAHFAAISSHVDIITLLCGEYGASASLKDKNGKNVADTAVERSCIKAAAMAVASEGSMAGFISQAIEESNNKVEKMQKKYEQALVDINAAREKVEAVEGNEDMTVARRFTFLMDLVTSETALESANLAKLIDMKEHVKIVENNLEREFLKRMKSASQLSICVICKERERSCVLMPCRHMACCSQCAHNPRFRSCPLCLSRVEHVSTDIGLRAPVAVALITRGSSVRLHSTNNDGIYDSYHDDREASGQQFIPYAPLVLLDHELDDGLAFNGDEEEAGGGAGSASGSGVGVGGGEADEPIIANVAYAR